MFQDKNEHDDEVFAHSAFSKVYDKQTNTKESFRFRTSFLQPICTVAVTLASSVHIV